MEVKTITDADILVPNKEHKNFTNSGKKIPKETTLTGNPIVINGLRRGEPFSYKLFVTDKQEYIYLKNIKNMDTTNVYLGADSTIVKMPSDNNFGTTPLISMLVGGAAAYYYAKKRNQSRIYLYTLIGAVAGFGIGKYFQSQGIVTFKKNK
jgi:hypothetical protein